MRSSFLAFVLAVTPIASFAAPTFAQTKDAEKPADTKAGEGKPGADAADAKTEPKNESKPAATDTTAATTTTSASASSTGWDDKKSSSDPTEVEGQTYYFIGARYRHTFLPKWMLNLFVDGGPSVVSIPSFGVEGGFRKDGFDIIGAITYADYSMKEFPFKGKSEADTAYEIVKSNLKLINLSADFLWGTDFSPKFSFQYGATAGLAIVFGELKRNQARPPTGTAPSDPDGYVKCGAPGEAGGYCDNSNDHYGEYAEPSWFNGGKKPNIYPIFGPMIAFRYKPARQFVARVDGGFNLFSGFFFGVGLNYGF
jgi:hypothetical protein